MLCTYSYLIQEKKYLFGEDRYYLKTPKEVGEYECDIEDFKKLFEQFLKKQEVAIVLRKQNGELWIYQPKYTSPFSKRQVGGWSLISRDAKYTDTYERSVKMQKWYNECRALLDIKVKDH